jgi:hypothetical protein
MDWTIFIIGVVCGYILCIAMSFLYLKYEEKLYNKSPLVAAFMDKIKLGVEKNLDNTEMKGGNTQ